jgi:HEAT repeat protein
MSAELLNADESTLSQLPFDLIELGLQETDPEVRAVAVYALGTRPEPQAVPLLISVLSDPSPFLARTASDSLHRLGVPAVPALSEALKHQDAQTRGLAARALALIADKSSIPALFHALEDDSTVVQYWADEGLERMGVGQVYFKPS